MEAVNLLPGYARPAHGLATLGKDLPTRRVLAVGGAVAGAAVIALGGLYVYERSLVNDKRNALAGVQADLAEAQAKAAPLRAVQSASATKLRAIQTISAGRVPWENMLRDLARVLPGKVQLQTVQVAVPTPVAAAPTTAGTTGAASAGATATSGFTVTGSASSHDRVALVLDRLAVLPWLSNVTLQSSTRAGGTSGSGADTFSIGATFDPAGVAR